MNPYHSANGFAVSAPVVERLAEQLLEIAPRYRSKFAPDAEEEFTRETYREYIREDERTTGGNK